MIIITTVTDIRNYLYDCRADLANVEPDAFGIAAEALRSSVHPAWGSDWEQWLDEHNHLVDEAVEATHMARLRAEIELALDDYAATSEKLSNIGKFLPRGFLNGK